ncbi:endonuclease MutS2 [Oceanirhabdus sp. W0125-5]|uniref:endonuclease MutS2 n=1 Tax=Oceanirhabdus sp. W0125-5 TaxID=2999116 RepID=UPI0022F3211B|nr:endonuclease MutS2 [Oceanirhabdus sp. W0125-5]WBW97854.1 endonuclease MutS2 [Oceanirhabdus sp. W0125-5]
MNINTFNTLGYNDLKEIIKGYCISGLGKQLIDKMLPSSNLTVIEKKLKETSEARKILDDSKHIPLEGIYDIRVLVEKVEKGGLLEADEVTHIGDFLRGCRKIKRFMLQQESYAPILSEYAYSMSELSNIEEEINRIIKNNKVDSSASKELGKIRRNIDATEGKIKEKLNKMLSSSHYSKYIQEFFVSMRNGRYVIPIKANYKNKVEGNIIDSSSKGTTVFIEPAAVNKLNSELSTLKYAEKAEEYQILAYLTGIIYEGLREIKINIELISEYDMISAKAKYSQKIDGIEPIINTRGYIKIVNGIHPLLEGDTVPLNFEVGDKYRSLIITGPNAGGKTVALKTIGILTLAMQSGIHVRAKNGTELSVFDDIFVDIGDNQSIKNALSTFSSHMKNISDILDHANNSSLILFDEIGTGTEPNEGTGLAIAILEELYYYGAITVATTHYADIKRYAYEHPEFRNAHMKFNPDTLEPLYKMVIGEGGESNALWISKKVGVKESVLKRAKGYIDDKKYEYNLVKRSKLRNDQVSMAISKKASIEYEYRIGDQVILLEKGQKAIVYQERDQLNNIVVLIGDEYKEINIKRVKLNIKREELYPEGYDYNTLFTAYKDRKLEHDLKRGSKKALKKIQKEIRKNRNLNE